MIRRMKVRISIIRCYFCWIGHTLKSCNVQADILKNLQPKIREKGYIDISDEALQNEFHTYMQLLKQGRGVMGKFAREHSTTSDVHSRIQMQQTHATPEEEEVNSREALHHLYKLTGKSKIAKVTFMLKRWLADPALGETLVFMICCPLVPIIPDRHHPNLFIQASFAFSHITSMFWMKFHGVQGLVIPLTARPNTFVLMEQHFQRRDKNKSIHFKMILQLELQCWVSL